MGKSVFSKPFTQQEAIPDAGIERAVDVLRSGRLHRYNLAEGETALADADKALRAAEASQAEAREERVRCQAQVEQAEIECRTVAEIFGGWHAGFFVDVGQQRRAACVDEQPGRGRAQPRAAAGDEE